MESKGLSSGARALEFWELWQQRISCQSLQLNTKHALNGSYFHEQQCK